MHWHVTVPSTPRQTFTTDQLDSVVAWYARTGVWVSLLSCQEPTCVLSHADELPAELRTGA